MSNDDFDDDFGDFDNNKKAGGKEEKKDKANSEENQYQVTGISWSSNGA